MAGLLPPPTPTRDYSRDEDSDSDVSEDSAGRNLLLFTLITHRISHICSNTSHLIAPHHNWLY